MCSVPFFALQKALVELTVQYEPVSQSLMNVSLLNGNLQGNLLKIPNLPYFLPISYLNHNILRPISLDEISGNLVHKTAISHKLKVNKIQSSSLAFFFSFIMFAHWEVELSIVLLRAQGNTMAKKTTPKSNGTNKADAKPDAAQAAQQLDPAMLEKIVEIRSKVHETFGQVAMAMMAIPRYRHQSIADMSHILLDPLIRDRVAIANSAPDEKNPQGNLSGIAIWASVSEEVDAKIRDQIKAGVFPIKLKADDWVSGDINWLLDVIAPNQQLTTSVIANFKQVIKEGDIRMHPLISRLVDPEALKKMGAAPIDGGETKQ